MLHGLLVRPAPKRGWSCERLVAGTAALEEIYGKQRIASGARAFTSSPRAYDGKIFCLSEDGDAFVIQAGPEFEVLGKNSLGEICMATPAIARRILIIRTESALFRIGQPAR